MGRTASELIPPPDPNLGVIEAMGQGWRLMREDFWSLWTITIVVMLIQGVSGPAAVIVAPPLLAGFYYVLARRMTGHHVEVKERLRGVQAGVQGIGDRGPLAVRCRACGSDDLDAGSPGDHVRRDGRGGPAQRAAQPGDDRGPGHRLWTARGLDPGVVGGACALHLCTVRRSGTRGTPDGRRPSSRCGLSGTTWDRSWAWCCSSSWSCWGRRLPAS